MSSMADDEEETCLPSAEQTQIINEINSNSTMKEGDTYYLLSSQWYSQYKNHTNQLTPLPPIDNHPLIISKDQTFQLKPSLQEGIDYVLVSEDIWKKLYGLYNGGPELPRKVISEGDQNLNSLVVEIYPLRVYIHDERDGKIYDVEISKKASMNCLYDQVKKLLGVGDDEKIHLWDFFDSIRSHTTYIASNQSLEEACVMNNEDILVEVKNRDDEEGCNALSNGFSTKYCFGSSYSSPLMIIDDAEAAATEDADGFILGEVKKEDIADADGFIMGEVKKEDTADADGFIMGEVKKEDTADVDGFIMGEAKKGDMGGLVGLQNLGNTCFMNSAIQCLVHTPPLVEYFMENFSEEINKGNPIGMQGELAIAFGDLLRKLWSSSGGGAINPSVFKKKLAQFAPQFGGFNQHDSHELLAFLMDGLHEDLNRVMVKPYVVLEDANGRSDSEVAKECWEFHKARNDSVIVDVCQGQYKLTLVCPECGRVSVTFDPFMYLSLPLLSETTRSLTITVFSSNGSALPKSYTVKVSKDGSLENLVDALSIECSLKSDETLLLAEIFHNAVYKYFEDLSDPVSEILDGDYLVAYRIPKKSEGYTMLEIVHGINGEKPRGTPLVTYLAEGEQRREDIQNAVHMAVKPLLIHMEMPNEEMEDDHEFRLFATDDNRGMFCRRIKSDFTGRLNRVLVDWSDTDFDIYDTSYLANLPAVYKPESGTSISLISCLEAFLKEEPLGPDDMWFCPSCKEHRQASKKLDLWKLPEILVVHLKRFAYSQWYRNKLDTLVDFPIHNLDLKEYVKGIADPTHESCMYELYAVSNHYGSLGFGHYTADAKVEDGNKWYHFDDSNVSPIAEDEIKTSAAYILFYKRVGHNEEAPQTEASCSSSV